VRVGLDGKYRPGFETLRFVHAEGLDGAFFRSPKQFSDTLDPGALRAARALADELGLYLEIGVGRVNPYVFDKNPEIAAWGDGDYRRGFERAARACVEMGCRDLWCVTGTYTDRFGGKAPWPEQLRATAAFLTSVRPMLRDLGIRLCLETHEEITLTEVLRLVEVDPDHLGLCLDTGNILVRAEDPAAWASRLAPHVRLTHLKDAVLLFGDGGLTRQVRTPGDGVLDWPAILGALGVHQADLNLSIEDHRGSIGPRIFDPAWRAGHPELTAEGVAGVVRLAWLSGERMARGEIPSVETIGATPWEEQELPRLRRGVVHLRKVVAELGLVCSTS
jgi:sugar phosphate isomerase/epimerase